jgi:hypothetical protein
MRRLFDVLVVALAIASGAALAGCGGATDDVSGPPAARLERVPGSPAGQIVLSSVGARRIGVQTAPVRPARRAARVVVPFSAIVYAPDGRAYAFVNKRPLVYVEAPVDIDHISGERAYLVRGPRAGARVVTVGAEELFGVQTGVLDQA